MNKKNILLPICAAMSLIIAGCGGVKKSDLSDMPAPGVVKSIVPTDGNSVAPEHDTGLYEGDKIFQNTLPPRVQIKPDDVILQIINTNLDIDANDEQILLLRKKDDPQSAIRVAVVDFDTVRNIYKLSWEGETQAVNMRGFTINLEDLVGDHSLQLVCLGLGKEKEQTIDVFRKTQGPGGISLFYQSILSLKSDGNIEIGRQERTEAYNLGQKNGVSFPVISYAHDSESDNLLDMVKTEFYWSYQDGLYIQGNIEKIPGKKIEELQLQKLFVSGEKAFEDFLDGIWYKMDPKNPNTLVLLNPAEKTINFFQNDIQEIYRWTSSYKTRLPHVLYINGKNDLVPFINIFISIEVMSVNSIAISISEGEFNAITGNQWDGSYFKLTDISPDTLAAAKKKEDAQTDMILNGSFKATDGTEFSFSYPLFTLTENGILRHGGFALSTVGVTVLELKVLDLTGLLSETRTYGIKFEKTDAAGANRLILQPGVITVSGFRENSESPLILEREMEETS